MSRPPSLCSFLHKSNHDFFHPFTLFFTPTRIRFDFARITLSKRNVPQSHSIGLFCQLFLRNSINRAGRSTKDTTATHVTHLYRLHSQHLDTKTYHRMHETRRRRACVCAGDRDSESKRDWKRALCVQHFPFDLSWTSIFFFPSLSPCFFVRRSRFVCMSVRKEKTNPCCCFCCFSPKAAYYHRTGDLSTRAISAYHLPILPTCFHFIL